MPSVLLMHGDAGTRDSLAAHLVQRGCQLSLHAGVRSGFDAVLSDAHDLIVWDGHDAVLDGEAVPALLRSAGYEGPILAWLSAVAPRHDEVDWTQRGFGGHVVWPSGGGHQVHHPGLDVIESILSAKPASRWDGLTFESMAGFDLLQQRFLSRLSGQMADMQAACAAQDWPTLTHLAHALKGAAGCFGLPRVSDAAMHLERSAKQGDAALAHYWLLNLDQAIPSPFGAGVSTCSNGSLA